MSSHFYDEGPDATGKKVFIAIPAYDNPDAALTFSLARSREALTAAGIQSALVILHQNCHVDDSRNSLVRDFLDSDCTDLVFIDADVTWEPKSLVLLCERDEDIIGGVYPYRREGSDNMPVRMMEGGYVGNGLREVEGLPTGFMKIKRHVLEKMAAERPWYFDKIYQTHLVFNRSEPDENHTRWGGDLDFCRRWREMGGKIYALEELRLGHVAKIIIYDSLAAHLRRLHGTTLTELAPRFRDGTEDEEDYNEVFRYAGNNYAADPGVLALCVGIARRSQGPILETGSGLSTALMAAVTDQTVHSLEHLPVYAAQTGDYCDQVGAENYRLICAPLKNHWYDVERMDLPEKFAFGFCDGPPRIYGTRMKFFEVFGPRCSVILVDDIKTDNGFANQVRQWAEDNGRSFMVLGRCALLQKVEAPATKEVMHDASV